MISDKCDFVESVTPLKYIAYIPKSLVITTLPYTKFEGTEFVRKNGRYRLSVLASEDVGVPYGVVPRLLLIWIATEAKVRKSREIELGRSFRQFLLKLNMKSTGGKDGSIGRVRRQLRSLFQCSISSSLAIGEWQDIESGMRLADHSHFWWQPHSEFSFKTGYIKLSEAFYNEIVYEAIPIDLRAVRSLQRSPMALDIYMWLSWRVFSLKRSCVIPWEELQKQFGATYKKRWHFERAFSLHLIRIKGVYPQVLAHSIKGRGLVLYPCQPHVSPNVNKSVG